MASNIAVKITADVIDLQTKFAVAKAESQALTKSLNDLARQAQAGPISDKLKADLTVAADRMLQAKNRTTDLTNEMRSLVPANNNLSSALGGVNRALGLFGASLSVGALVSFGMAVFRATEEISRQADVLQLSVTAYQAFAQSAKVADVAVETVNQAMVKFNNSQGQAQKQTGEQAEAFRQLGVNAFLPAEQSLPAVAKALLAVKDNAERARLETILFGRSGQQLNAALSQWAKGVNDLSKEMRDMGLMIDPEIVARADRMDKRMTIAWERIKVGTAAAADKLIEYLALMDTVRSGAVHKLDPITPAAPAAGADTKRDYGLEQANALANAFDTGRTRVAFLRKGIEEMQAQMKNPNATEEMRNNMRSAIAAANSEIAGLQNKRVFSGTGFSNAGDEAIAQAKAAIAEINADATKGDADRRAAIDKAYADLLASTKLNAAQRLAVETSKNAAIAQANRQAANEQRQLDQSTAQSEQRIAQIGFDQKRAVLEAEVAAGRLTRQEALTQLLQLTDQETSLRMAALSKAQQGYSTDTMFFIQKEQEKVVAVAEGEAQKAAIRRQIELDSANESQRIWRNAQQQIMSAEQTFTQALFSGRVGLFGALQAAGLQFAQSEIQQTLKGVTERMLLKRTELAQDQSLGQLGVLGQWLFEGQKTAATTVGETTRTGVKEAAAATENAGFLVRVGRWIASELGMTTATTAAETTRAGAAVAAQATAKAAESAMNVTSALSYTAVAATGAAASQAFIPIVGPALAAGAAASTFAMLQPFVALAALDTGTNYVPRDMPVLIHAGERVVPKADNAAMIAALNGGAANQNGGGGISLTYHEAPGSTKSGREAARDMVREVQHARRIGKLK